MKFLVMGAGAVGSAFGGFLRLAGHEVSLVGRNPHLDAIRAGGLKIRGIWGEHVASGFSLYSEPGAAPAGFDAVFLTVKSFDTRAAGRQVKSLLNRDTLLISLQNGIGNVEALQEVAGHSLVLGGRVIFGIVPVQPGEIEITVYTQPVMIGFPRGVSPGEPYVGKAKAVARAIDAGGIPCEYTEEIEKHLWAKLLYNCALNPMSAIHGVHYGALGEDSALRATMDGIVREIFEVAAARGTPLFWNRPEDFLALFYSKLLPDTYYHRSSMLQDIGKGRRTEIDSLCGMVVKYGKKCGVDTPLNAEMLEKIRAMF